MQISKEMILDTLKNWGWNPGEIEEIVAKLAENELVEDATAEVGGDMDMIHYEIKLTNEGINFYVNWCHENGFTPDLKGKLENTLSFTDQSRDSVRNTLLEWGALIQAEKIDFKPDFPNRDEAYAILRGENGRFAFAWGPKYPYEDEVPAENVPAGESGLEWFDTEDKARAAMNRAMEAWSDVRGGK